MSRLKWLLNGLVGLLTMLYPFVVYFGSRYLDSRQIALLILLSLAVRWLISRSARHWSSPLILAGMVYFAVAVWNGQLATLRYYPAMANVTMLLLFASSLLYPPPLVERIARLQHPDLPPSGVIYTRRVTQVWCLFFVVNGTLALITARWCSFEIWSLYNGFIAYIMMGILFAGEYLVRIKTQSHVR
jgi:uncharacterized membrane protein